MIIGKIHSKLSSKEYEDNWDKIFKKKEEVPEEKQEETKKK
jgi:hypothetical protein